MKNSQVVGIGHQVPEKVVTNFDLEKMMDTNDEWIRERTGIRERRWIQPGETSLDLAYGASVKALKQANMQAEDIDLIVLGCMASDYMFPGGGCLLQEKLGLPGIPAIDIRNACSGFIYGLAIADKFLKTGTYRTALVVGAEVQSTSLNLSTEGRDVAVIFADGAGAVVLKATDDNKKGVLTTHLHADGKHKDKLCMKRPSVNEHPRINSDLIDSGEVFPHMEGRSVFKHAVTRFPEVIKEALDATGYQMEDIDLLVPHQANLRITEAVGNRLGIAPEKVYSNIQRYGNTTAASIPIAMSEAFAEGKIVDGSLVCLAAFGAGFTWASALVRF